MGYKTIKAEELDDRITAYWVPTDYDRSAAFEILAGLVRRWPGYVRLTVDDATQVLTAIDYRFETGAYQEIWQTRQTPTEVIRRTTEPASFDEVWYEYKCWDDYVRFAQEKHISENTNFLVAVEAYRQAPSVQAQLDLYGRFIDPDSAEQVNLDAGTVAAIEARTDGGADVFDAAQQFVVTMLRNEFMKFQAWYRAQPLT